jgi:hypothetical protein
MEIHVCSLKNAEEKTDGECFAGNRTTHQGNVKKRGFFPRSLAVSSFFLSFISFSV